MEYINSDKLKIFDLNRNNTCVIVDFDKTITSHESDDSWETAGKLLGKKFNKEIDALWKKYRPIELDYNMDVEKKRRAMEEWYKECMILYYKYGLTTEKVTEAVKTGNLIFRDGAKRFLRKTFEENIPVVMLSAGIGNVIEEFLKQQGCYYSNIYIIANFIEFDENGYAKEFDMSTMIHTLNKSIEEKLPKEQADKLESKKYKILIGDLIEDINMIEKKEFANTLKIGMLDYTTDNLVEMYNNAFDIVLTDEDACFEEIKKIFRSLVAINCKSLNIIVILGVMLCLIQIESY